MKTLNTALLTLGLASCVTTQHLAEGTRDGPLLWRQCDDELQCETAALNDKTSVKVWWDPDADGFWCRILVIVNGEVDPTYRWISANAVLRLRPSLVEAKEICRDTYLEILNLDENGNEREPEEAQIPPNAI